MQALVTGVRCTRQRLDPSQPAAASTLTSCPLPPSHTRLYVRVCASSSRGAVRTAVDVALPSSSLVPAARWVGTGASSGVVAAADGGGRQQWRHNGGGAEAGSGLQMVWQASSGPGGLQRAAVQGAPAAGRLPRPSLPNVLPSLTLLRSQLLGAIGHRGVGPLGQPPQLCRPRARGEPLGA